MRSNQGRTPKQVKQSELFAMIGLIGLVLTIVITIVYENI